MASLPPPIAGAVSAAATKSIDDLTRTKYAINLAVANLDSTFRIAFPFTKMLLINLRQNVDNTLIEPINDLHSNGVNLLQKANQIQQFKNNPLVNAPIGRILQSAISEGSQCIQNYGLSVSNALVTNTMSAADGSQRVSLTL